MSESQPTGTTARSRILVVDDISKNLQVVGTMLRNEGYHVMPATSGAQALERAQAQPPDLVLLDLMMPGMDGLEACRKLKEDSRLRHLPVIFLTASNEMEHLVRGFEAGAVDYITKPFNAPELLARVRTHLELKHARQRLREMNDEKNEFMGIVAHDLRNPLSAIKGYVEMILEDTSALGTGGASDLPALTREIEANTRRIGDTAARMAEMTQNLLDTNRIERGELQLNIASVDLRTLAQAVVEAHRPRAEAKRQRLEFDPGTGPATAALDATVTTQVLENLISNAVKYSPAGKDIDVRILGREGILRVEVQDDGPGLSAEDLGKLFGKFARLSAKPTGGEHSTGLGLSIVKRMVEAMNGRVGCVSEPGRGATFYVELPRCDSPIAL